MTSQGNLEKNVLWFYATINLPRGKGVVCMLNNIFEIYSSTANYTLRPPDGCVYVSDEVEVAGTAYTDDLIYFTSIGLGCKGTAFITGIAWQVPPELQSLDGATAIWTADFKRNSGLR